jgi:allophanate hydrolase
VIEGFDALLLPTTTEHPSLAQIQADPYSINRRMGTYTNFANLLNMAAVAVPGVPTKTGTPFGVTIVARTFGDQIAVDIAARLSGTTPTLLIEAGCELAVSGAYRRDQPLHFHLEQAGARYVHNINTNGDHRFASADNPVARDEAELFRISEAGLGRLLASLPAPAALAALELENGRTVIGLTTPITDAGRTS